MMSLYKIYSASKPDQRKNIPADSASPATNVRKKFINSIKLLLYQSQVFGIISSTFDEKTIKTSKLRLFYNIGLIVTFLPVSILAMYTVSWWDTPFIFKTITFLTLLANSTYFLTIWLSGILNCKKFIELLKKLIEYDEKLQKKGLVMDYDRLRKRIFLECVLRHVAAMIALILLVYFLFFSKDANILQRTNVWSTEMIRHATIVMNSVVCHQIGQLILMIRHRFYLLNNGLTNLQQRFRKTNKLSLVDKHFGSENSTRNLNIFYNLCAMHHQLSQMIKILNETFGVILLFKFGMSFVAIVISLFFCTSALQAPSINWRDVIIPVFMSWTYMYDIVNLCNACYTTTEEANRSGEIIHKFETEDCAIKDEIEMFSLQIANEQVEFNAAGFFVIDFTLLFSIIGGVTTYIIILIQLSATLAQK